MATNGGDKKKKPLAAFFGSLAGRHLLAGRKAARVKKRSPENSTKAQTRFLVFALSKTIVRKL
jgi:hypothetical protein